MTGHSAFGHLARNWRHARPLLRWLALTVLVALVLGACAWTSLQLLRHWQPVSAPMPGGPHGDRVGLAVESASIPHLQSAPQPERRAYDAVQQRRLQSTGWTDRQHDIAHIPIDDAMHVIADARLDLAGALGFSDAPAGSTNEAGTPEQAGTR